MARKWIGCLISTTNHSWIRSKLRPEQSAENSTSNCGRRLEFLAGLQPVGRLDERKCGADSRIYACALRKLQSGLRIISLHFEPALPVWINSTSFCGVTGAWLMRTPNGRSASSTAEITAAAAGIVLTSPAPLAPSGFKGDGVEAGIDARRKTVAGRAFEDPRQLGELDTELRRPEDAHLAAGKLEIVLGGFEHVARELLRLLGNGARGQQHRAAGGDRLAARERSEPQR